MILKPLVDALSTLKDVPLNIRVYENVVWYYNDRELAINTDKASGALWDGDGNTYSWEANIMQVSEDGFAFFWEADGGCGGTDTIIVKLSEREY